MNAVKAIFEGPNRKIPHTGDTVGIKKGLTAVVVVVAAAALAAAQRFF